MCPFSTINESFVKWIFLKSFDFLCRIYTFAWVARRIARRTTRVPITYSPRHLLRYSPRHLWRSHSKHFFEHESKVTNGDYVMCTNMWMFVRMWKLIIHTETEAYKCSCKWWGEARARMCKCSFRVGGQQGVETGHRAWFVFAIFLEKLRISHQTCR